MRKLLCWMILLVTLISTFPSHAQEAPVLPDPGPSVKAEGKLLPERAVLDGIICDAYEFDFYRGTLSFSFVLWVYESKVKNCGFAWEKVSHESTDNGNVVSEWYTATKDGMTAWLHLTGRLLGQSTVLTVYVPEGMGIALENKQSSTAAFYNDASAGWTSGGATSFYNDSFVDSTAAGTASFYNEMFDGFDEPWTGSSYSDSPTNCSYCHGTGTCPECYGSGHFRNPYTGSYLECSCDHGDCPICDGEGVW